MFLSIVSLFIQIKSNNKILKLRKITRQSQKTNTITLKTLNNIVGGKHKFTKFGTAFDSFSLKFKLDSKILWKYQILVYYVLSNGDVVGDSREIEIEPCLSNKVGSTRVYGYRARFSTCIVRCIVNGPKNKLIPVKEQLFP